MMQNMMGLIGILLVLTIFALCKGLQEWGMRSLVLTLLLAAAPLAAAERPANFTLYDEARPLPEIAFVEGEARTRTLADFRGQAVLLNLWATWCAPCREEMPALDWMQAALGGPDFEVVALSLDRAGVEPVRRFYRETGVKDIAIYLDASGKALRDLKVTGLPTTLLIDREGRELGRLIDPAEWDAPEMVALLRAHRPICTATPTMRSQFATRNGDPCSKPSRAVTGRPKSANSWMSADVVA